MAASSSSRVEDEDPPHVIGGDLNIPAKDAIAKDDPNLYYYWVHLTDLERDKSHEKGKSAAKVPEDRGMIGSLIEVQCGMMRLVRSLDVFANLCSLPGIIAVVTACLSPSLFFAVSFVTVSIAMLLWLLLGPLNSLLRRDMAWTRLCLKKRAKESKISRKAKLIKGRKSGKTKKVHLVRSKRN